MKSSSNNFVIAMAIGVGLLAAGTASAGGFQFGGGHGHGGGVKFHISGGNHNHHKHHHNKFHHHDYWWHHKYYHRPYVRYYTPAPVIVTTPVVPSAPYCNISLAAEEPIRTQIPIGSVIVLDGQPLGAAKGTVRLLVGNMGMPVEVLEWTATSAKIRMPLMDLAGPMRAELEVLRADGTLASKQPVELTLATPSVAARN
jgi:hypothetical protein